MSEQDVNRSGLINVAEKEITPTKGAVGVLFQFLFFCLTAAVLAGGILIVYRTEIGTMRSSMQPLGIVMIVLAIVLLVVFFILFAGYHVINPNEALVMTYFGRYYGTIKKPGFYFTHPFASGFNPTTERALSVSAGAQGAQANVTQLGLNKKISTKTMVFNNEKQKVNDALGNPIIIGAVVIWRVTDPTKAVFNVDNYKKFLSIQCDTTIRNNARLYPYDNMDDRDDADDAAEKTLRGSSIEIAENMKTELQERVKDAGLEIQEVRITHLAYSDEIAAAMLQRQQAVAIIAARRKIVEGAVSMVKMAIDQLGEEEIVVLDEERKAAMVSNLLVVLCGNKDAQPIVNSGSIY